MGVSTYLIDSVGKFYHNSNNVRNHRYLSWEHCYLKFVAARARNNTEADIDNLSLHLSFYLASWGMYRGSSFLLQRDYRVHYPIVREILKPEYNILLNLRFEDLLNNQEGQQEKLAALSKELTRLYRGIRGAAVGEDVESEVSNILITKVLLGTLACTPAYDRFFIAAIRGIRAEKITTGTYNTKSMLGLAKFYQQHSAEFERVRKTLKLIMDKDSIYPQMKFIDMALWQIGFDNSLKFKNQR